MLTQKNFLPGVMLLILLIYSTGRISAQPDVWATAYYAGWMQGQYNNGHLPAEEIDYSAVTHIVHFALVPNSDGTLNSTSNSITETNSSELITRAHAEGKKVIICLGGWNSGEGFRGAVSSLNRTTFIANLIDFITTRGYDGIDIDWEPLQSSDATLYIAFITALRTALEVIQPTPLLTAAVGGSRGDILGQVHQFFDQINIMTYDMSGAWPGWVTWHNSPIYDGGFVFPSTGNPVPSADGMVEDFISSGVPISKIGIGIDFYGYVWNGGSGPPTGGVTEPRQEWTSAPYVAGNVAYYDIMDDYYQPSLYRWDDAPKAAYLSIDNSGSTDDKFISYDDETTVQEKFDYARSKGIGGLIVWELGGGYRPNMPAGQRDLLLQAVKSALGGGGVTSNDETGEEIPGQFTLEQNYPNPFNPATTIQFFLPIATHVKLDIYNITGEKVTTLVNENLSAGTHNVTWDASNMASGVYVYQLHSGSITLNKKMTLTK